MEKIDERHTESESEAEKDLIVPPSIIQASAAKSDIEEKDPKQNSEENQKVQGGIISSSVLDPITENEPEESNEAQEALADDKEKDEDAVKDGNDDENAEKDPESDKVKSLQRRLSSQKSFEMEDLIGKSNYQFKISTLDGTYL